MSSVVTAISALSEELITRLPIQVSYVVWIIDVFVIYALLAEDERCSLTERSPQKPIIYRMPINQFMAFKLEGCSEDIYFMIRWMSIKLKRNLAKLPITHLCVHGNHEERPYLIRFFDNGKEELELDGTIEIIDAYGTFFQRKEVSYDIWRAGDSLYKHIPESSVFSLGNI